MNAVLTVASDYIAIGGILRIVIGIFLPNWRTGTWGDIRQGVVLWPITVYFALLLGDI